MFDVFSLDVTYLYTNMYFELSQTYAIKITAEIINIEVGPGLRQKCTIVMKIVYIIISVKL